MSFFLVKSPLALAIGEALIEAGSVIEMPDGAEAERLVANGTLELAEIDPDQAAAFEQAKTDAGIPPGEVLVATPDDIVPAADVQVGDAPAEAAAAEPTPQPAAPKPSGKPGKGSKA
jgi:hypothetical protein